MFSVVDSHKSMFDGNIIGMIMLLTSELMIELTAPPMTNATAKLIILKSLKKSLSSFFKLIVILKRSSFFNLIEK
jgi:hypothetical protein